MLVDGLSGEPTVPNGTLGDRFTESGKGRWNLDLGDIDPQLTLAGGEAVAVDLPRFDTPAARAGSCGVGCPSRDRRTAGHHRLRPATRPVRRRQAGAARKLAHRLRRPVAALHAGVAGAVHRGPGCGRGEDRAGSSRVTPRSRAAAP